LGLEFGQFLPQRQRLRAAEEGVFEDIEAVFVLLDPGPQLSGSALWDAHGP
jgi:hypothetical protein